MDVYPLQSKTALTYACCTFFCRTRSVPCVRAIQEHRKMTLALCCKGLRILQTPPLPTAIVFSTLTVGRLLWGEIWNLCLQACVPTVLRKSRGRMTTGSIMEKIPNEITFAVKLIAQLLLSFNRNRVLPPLSTDPSVMCAQGSKPFFWPRASNSSHGRTAGDAECGEQSWLAGIHLTVQVAHGNVLFSLP